MILLSDTGAARSIVIVQSSNIATIVPTAAVALAGAVQFFVVTNFASWLAFYPHTAEGLLEKIL